MSEHTPRSMDGILPPKPKAASTQNRKQAQLSRLRYVLSKRVLILSVLATLSIAVVCLLTWFLFLKTSADKDPFTSQVASSVQFPLYYPKRLPPGFRIDASSVSQPQTGVVIFSLTGPNSQRVYFSEEARPENYDIGGFFKKFSKLKEYGISGGSIAIGEINKGRTVIGSMVNNKTWLIANTNDQRVTPTILTTVLKSLVANGTSQ